MSEEVFGGDLLQGEQILWSGQPDPSIIILPEGHSPRPIQLALGRIRYFLRG